MSCRSAIRGAALVAAVLATPCVAQTFDFGKYTNFNGQWARPRGNPSNWIPMAGPPPLAPECHIVWENNQADVETGGPDNWPTTFCIPADMPAMMNLYEPMEIIVLPETTYILISHTDNPHRRMYTDGRGFATDAALTYAGYSIGRWVDEDGDGKYDVLEVETGFLEDSRSYDISGVPFNR
jgi:hypothetical protein